MYVQMADKIIDMAGKLGYGVDVNFLQPKNAIKIIPLSGRPVSFSKFEDALTYLEGVQSRRKELMGY